MWPQGARVIQDPVHGLMQFRRSESLVVDLLSCRELQRLRRVRQLGFASFVFPGAEHSRFVHSVGAAYLAARIGRHLETIGAELLPEPLRLDKYSIRDFCVAALCHDLGHGPFSHVWERAVIGEVWDRAAWARALGLGAEEAGDESLKWHEMVSQAFLAWEDGQLHQLLEGNERDSSLRVRDLLAGRYYLQYLSRLLRGDVDLDRSDFLLRDGLMAGLPFGRFQLDRLIACLTFGFDGANKCHVGLDSAKGLHTAVELLKARADLYEVLYFHKTVIGMEGLLASLLRRLKDLNVGDRNQLENAAIIGPLVKMLRGMPVALEDLLGVDDYSVWTLVSQVQSLFPNDATAVQLAQRLLIRDPLRAIPVDAQRIQQFLNSRGDAREMITNVIRKYVTGEPKYYYHIEQSEFELLSNRPHEKALLVDTNDRSTSDLRDHPAIRSIFNDRQDLGVRLLVPREARDEIAQLVEGKR